jgi:hypothetical protein
MTTVELRCKRHKWGEVELEDIAVVVKCPQHGETHEWRLSDIIAAAIRGEIVVFPFSDQRQDRAA